MDSHASMQLKKLAAYLDPHLLLLLLQHNIGSESQGLQDQIKSRLICADQVRAQQLTQEAEQKAQKLLQLLHNRHEVSRMRNDSQFNFDQLNRGPHKVTI